MQIDDNIVRLIWRDEHSPDEDPLQRPNPPIVVRAWMEHIVQHVVSVMRDEGELHVSRATVEWNQGMPVVTTNIRATVPMDTLVVMADEWREEVGA